MSKPHLTNSIHNIISSIRENRGVLNYYAILMNGLEDVRRKRASFTSAVHVFELAELFERYYNSIRALYNILLLEYRGFSKAYMDIAVKAFRIWLEAVNPLASREAGVEASSTATNPKKKMSGSDPKKFIEELKSVTTTPTPVSIETRNRYHDSKAFIELLEQYLGDTEKTLLHEVLSEPTSFINSFYVVLAILDKAVEEIVNALHKAGILVKGKDLVVGVVE